MIRPAGGGVMFRWMRCWRPALAGAAAMVAAAAVAAPAGAEPATTVSYPAGTSHRFVSPAERRRQGISDGLIRMSIGFEPLEQIQREVGRGLG